MSGSLLQSAQGLLASVLALARTRLELVSTELQEELMRLFSAALGAVAVLLLAALGAAFAALALVIALGEEQRALAAALIGGGFLALAAGAGFGLRRVMQDKPRLLGASLAELQRDSADYRGRIAADLEPLARNLGAADRAVATLRAHPVIATAAAGAIAFMGPRRLLGWAARVLPLYSLLRRI